MTAQTDTVDNAITKPLLQDQIPTTDTETPQQGDVNPQDQTTPKPQEQVDKEIAIAEKRATDKVAYLEKLTGELSDYDREINEQREKLKKASESQQQHQEPQQQQATLPEAHQDAADDLGLSGEKFINLLRENPDEALAAIVNAAEEKAEKRILGKMPMQFERHRIEQETRGKLEVIHQELGDEGFQNFRQLIAQYQQQGFTPTPEQASNELMFGTPTQQRKLMEYGKLMLQQNGGQPPEQGDDQHKPFPMAPGGGTPNQPGQRQTGNKWERTNVLPEGMFGY